MLTLLRRHGCTTTSFQSLEPGLAYWFDPAGDACVAYADTGRAWVAVGTPIAAPAHQAAVLERFVAAAAAQGRRVRFFAVEQADFGGAAFASMHLGEQAFWQPEHWPAVVHGKRSLREQIRRARAKGVSARHAEPGELAAPHSPVRRAVDALVTSWQDTRQMAPMGFVVQLDLDTAHEERRIFLAERDGAVIGVLAAVPIYARKGWFFEDVLRHPHAPNGTIELLFDHAMRALAAEGSQHVTCGLAPLVNTPSRLLRWIRDHARWLYHFDGLYAFRSKLMPDGWQPVYLAYPGHERGIRAVIDVLTAFAHGSLVRFGLATLRHRAAAVTRVLALLLLPWIAAMALADSTRWFPSRTIQLAWIGFDLVLFALLMALATRWRRTLAMALAGAALVDFTLGCVQAGLYNIPRARGPVDWLIMAVSLLAPLFATVFLWTCRDRASSTAHGGACAHHAGSLPVTPRAGS